MTNASNPKLGERPMQTIDDLCDSIGASLDASRARSGDEPRASHMGLEGKLLLLAAALAWPAFTLFQIWRGM